MRPKYGSQCSLGRFAHRLKLGEERLCLQNSMRRGESGRKDCRFYNDCVERIPEIGRRSHIWLVRWNKESSRPQGRRRPIQRPGCRRLKQKMNGTNNDGPELSANVMRMLFLKNWQARRGLRQLRQRSLSIGHTAASSDGLEELSEQQGLVVFG